MPLRFSPFVYDLYWFHHPTFVFSGLVLAMKQGAWEGDALAQVRTIAGTCHFAILDGMWLIRPPPVWPLIELELRYKNGRVGRVGRKLMMPNFKVFGHLIMS